MPNPKAGTVVAPEDIGRAVTESKAGRVEFRLDKTANIHVSIGKVSFDEQKIFENFSALMEALVKARPAAAKGNYIKHITMTSTMGPGIKLDVNLAQSMEEGE
jgi:large subunit ribosomal protein L1